jgi:hypothetical protein
LKIRLRTIMSVEKTQATMLMTAAAIIVKSGAA